MRSEALPEIPSEENFYLKMYMLLALRIALVTVNKTPFLDSLIPLRNLKEESSFERSFLAILGTMAEFSRQKAPRSVTFFFGLLQDPSDKTEGRKSVCQTLDQLA